MEKICIIGAGSWGSALAISLGKKGHDVCLWMRDVDQCANMVKSKENTKYLAGVIFPQNVQFITNIEMALKGAAVIVLSISSQAIRQTLRNCKPYITEDQIIVNVSKGLEKNTNMTISSVVKEECPNNKFVVLSGPSHAEEVCKDMPTTVVASSRCLQSAEFIQDVFITPKFRVYTNPDIIGVELGGALKNIVAFGAGVCDGLGYGDNTKAALMTRGIREITRLGVAMGSRASTFSGLSGIGDLIVTCTSEHSRNRRAGIMIGQGKSLEDTLKEVKMVVEGITATQVAFELSKQYNVDMPITREIYEVLYANKDVKEAVIELMLRSKTHEIEEVVYDID